MSREQRDVTRADAGRKERLPLGIKRSKMAVKDKQDGYVYRWINDTVGRIQDAQNGGYEFVANAVVGEGDITNRNQSVGSDRVSRIVGKDDNGNPTTAYLMRIKQEWYKEDQGNKQKVLDDLDAALKRGQAKPVDNGYIPAQGINIGARAG